MKLVFPPILVFVYSTMCPFFAAGAKYNISNKYSNRDSQTFHSNRKLKDASQTPTKLSFPVSISKDYGEDDYWDGVTIGVLLLLVVVLILVVVLLTLFLTLPC
jgi:hypothetical protein